jgi:hypothetical protein
MVQQLQTQVLHQIARGLGCGSGDRHEQPYRGFGFALRRRLASTANLGIPGGCGHTPFAQAQGQHDTQRERLADDQRRDHGGHGVQREIGEHRPEDEQAADGLQFASSVARVRLQGTVDKVPANPFPGCWGSRPDVGSPAAERVDNRTRCVTAHGSSHDSGLRARVGMAVPVSRGGVQHRGE